MLTTHLAPLVKWPGGKRRLIRHIVPLVPDRYVRYFEPFVGGGALFFYLLPTVAYLSDSNWELINCYQQVKEDVDGVIKELRRWCNSEEQYYFIRDLRPRSKVVSAARFIYLTSLSFNGIYRVNKAGHYNVPYGQRKHIDPCNMDRLRLYSSALKSTTIDCKSFDTALSEAKRGDFVYLDPPYTVAHGKNGFLKYNDRIFSWSDQLKLAHEAQTLADRGCIVVVSNADHESICELYRGFNSRCVERQSAIAADPSARRTITERLFYS